MNNIILVIIGILALIGIAIIWVRGINYMDEHYPDYRGEDLFNETENKSYDKSRDTETTK
jgi:hypothetical protein